MRRQRQPLEYYRLLGVLSTATPAEVKGAWRRAAFATHPDRFTDPASRARAEERFKGLNEAYSVLSDPGRRRVYDAAMMRAGARAAAAAPRGQARARGPITPWAARLVFRWFGIDVEVEWHR